MFTESKLQFALTIASLTLVFIVVRHWRKTAGVGLLLTYLLSFATIHLLAPVLYLIPWYGNLRIEPTTLGLRESTLALVAFALGAELGLARIKRLPSLDPSTSYSQVDSRLTNMYLAWGIFIYAVLIPASRGIPTLTALVSMALPMIVAAIAVKCWAAWHEERQPAMWAWVASTALFPALTVLTQGFLGFGFIAMLTLFAFVASYYHPRWRVVTAGLVLSYIGLSVYVTYMRDRTDIRAVVWTGGTLRESVEQAAYTFSDFEWFDPNEVAHLDRIDGRLNQDFLVGLAVENLENNNAQFANGATIGDAILALVPRAIWPNKPIAAGSGDLVSTYTGLIFPQGTSVGIGQVMECYVNFGSVGVVLGFVLIGACVVFIDRMALRHLIEGDLSSFVIWYLPGLAFLQVGGSFVELGGVAASGLVVGLLLRHVAVRRVQPARLGQPVGVAAEGRYGSGIAR